MRTSEIAKLPVVTLAGEDVAQLKDIVFAAGGGEVGGFTLAGRGLLAGPLKQSLLWTNVLALGADAVMIEHEDALSEPDAVLDHSAATGGSGGNVLKSRVLTDQGTDLGEVVDVIIEVGAGGREQCDVVGYEIAASETLAPGNAKGSKLLIPLPDTIAASGEHLMVPASATEFVRDDLAGFGAAVDDFRSQLSKGSV
ncbi:PRC-barrel domain-containing protein [Jatrophihabitans fulvus]